MSNKITSNAWKSGELASNHSTSPSWCMYNGGCAHLRKRVNFLSVSQVCLFLIRKRRLTHFSLSNFWSPSQVLQHHQKWFMIDLDHLANFSHFANFLSWEFLIYAFAYMPDIKLVNDVWTYFFKKGLYLYVAIRIHAPYFKAIRIFHSFKQFRKTKFFHHNRICNTVNIS